MMRKNNRQIWAVLCCLSLTSCATFRRSDLYFGRDIADGGQVSEQQWKAFSDSVISRYFPEGYTEWNADGRWKDIKTKVTITEPTKVATFFGKASKQRDAALDRLLSNIYDGFTSKAYCAQIVSQA